MKRRVLLGVLLLVVASALGGAFLHLRAPPNPGVTVENFRLLRAGMTLGRVERILGPHTRVLPGFCPPEDAGVVLDWEGGDITVSIAFRDAEVVMGTAYLDGKGGYELMQPGVPIYKAAWDWLTALPGRCGNG